MDLKYLKDLLVQAKQLSQYRPISGEELKIKTRDALDEFNIMDASTSISIQFLNFSSDFAASKSKLVAILESKVTILEGRIQHKLQATTRTVEQIKAAGESKLLALQNALNLQNRTIDEVNRLRDMCTDNVRRLEDELKKGKTIWKIKSSVTWTFIVSIFLGLLWGVYELGKDIGQSAFDLNKQSMYEENELLKDSISVLNGQIKSLRKPNTSYPSSE